MTVNANGAIAWNDGLRLLDQIGQRCGTAFVWAAAITLALLYRVAILCGAPGLGRLARQRDLPLVADITTLVTLATSIAGLLTGAAGAGARRTA